MGVDTHLYLNTRWRLEDIIRVIERTQKVKVEVVTLENMVGYHYFQFNKRQIFVAVNSQTPIGSATYLSLHADDEAHKIFKGIADVLGGIFEDNDCDGKCEMIQGKISDEDAIPYFAKYAIIEDGIDEHDFNGFINSVNSWYDKCHKDGKPASIIKLIETIKAIQS